MKNILLKNLYRTMFFSILKNILIMAIFAFVLGIILWTILLVRYQMVWPYFSVVIFIIISAVISMCIGYQFFIIVKIDDEYYVEFYGFIKKKQRVKINQLRVIGNGASNSLYFFFSGRQVFLNYFHPKIRKKIKRLYFFIEKHQLGKIRIKGNIW